MTHSFERHLSEDRRLSILILLAASAGYRANVYTIEAVLADMGHAVSNDRVLNDLAWLAEQGLLATSQVGGVTIGTINTRGVDVARGRAVVPGVKRPQPD